MMLLGLSFLLDVCLLYYIVQSIHPTYMMTRCLLAELCSFVCVFVRFINERRRATNNPETNMKGRKKEEESD